MMVRVAVLAAGGIVLRQEKNPLIAVVRLRKRDEWVLPKGKLDEGETARAAAEREVLEETGHKVSVHEFLGTLVYESGGRSKVVHYWRMETRGGPSHALMNDVTAVDWLPLEAAIGRLSRSYEQAFLANVGPLALAALQQSKAKPATTRKRRRRRVVAVEPARAEPASPPPELIAAAVAPDQGVSAESDGAENDVVALEAPMAPAEFGEAAEILEQASASPAVESPSDNDEQASAVREQRLNLVQKVRDWLRRAA